MSKVISDSVKKRFSKQGTRQSPSDTEQGHGAWSGKLDANCSVWNWTGESLGPGGVVLGSLSVSLVMLFITLPVLAVAQLLIYLATPTTVSATSLFRNQSLLLVILAVCLVGAGITFFMLAQSSVTRFAFDSRRSVLEYTEHRPFQRPLCSTVDFDAIVSVTPIRISSNATYGHFSVVFRPPNESIRDMRMGQGISLAQLELHAEWLLKHLGDRVQPMLELDT